MDKIIVANSVATELERCIARLDALDALLAAAHLDAAMDALRSQFGIERRKPISDDEPCIGLRCPTPRAQEHMKGSSGSFS